MKEKFLLCVVKTTGYYYKKIALVVCIGIIICFATWMIATVSEIVFPKIVSILTPLPLWVYIPVGFVVIPILVATVVCYVNRHEKEIEEADKEFVCPQSE